MLISWGFDERYALAVGGELGAVAAFPENDEGERSLVGALAGAVPVLLRVRDSIRVYDLELAATARLSGGRVHRPGLRATAGLGLSTLRVGPFMPHALLWLGYEHQLAEDGNPTEHGLRVGTRVGVDWDVF